jgi:TonB family protein
LAKTQNPLTPVTCGFPHRFLAFRGMAHALLLSPDDQAVNAITGVLEELSVTCERPMDGVSAAHKLNSSNFDLVLVDCENLPAAKLVFDVCRRGNNGNNPVPIAIVDGRAGLPTAFRLGAELILTKPVAKDQARTTIRAAVSRVRKDVATDDNASAQLESAASAVSGEGAYAAAASSSQLTSFADPAPSYVSSPVSGASLAAAPDAAVHSAFAGTLSATVLSANMASAVDQDQSGINVAPSSLNSKILSASLAASSLSEPSSVQSAAVRPMSVRPLTPSDDPVLAELERTEQEEEERRIGQQKQNTNVPKTPDNARPSRSAAKAGVAAYSSRHRQRKTRGSIIALLVLILVMCGFYAAWMFQPGFQAIAQPEIDRVLAMVGMAAPATPSLHPAKPVRFAPPAAAEPAPAPANADATPTAASDSARSSTSSSTAGSTLSTIALVTGPTATATASSVTVPSAAATTTTETPARPNALATPLSAAKAVTAASAVGKPESSSNSNATPSSAPLPGEDVAVILSSKGAEKRLAYSVPAKYPTEALPAKKEGTVVLKAVVDESGKVDGVRLVEGNDTLAIAAIQAVKQWRYRPYVRDGKAQSFQTVVIVDFQRP